MPAYQFEAVDNRGQAIKGVETARSVSELADRLRKRDCTIIDIREERRFLGGLLQELGVGTRLPLYPTVVMLRQFATLLKAGVPLLSSLDTVSRQGINTRVDRAIFAVQKDVRTGKSLSQAFEAQGDLFPPLTTPLIKAGEVAGELDEMLERLATHLERELALIRSWRQAAAYPVLLFFLCSALTVGLVSYIFPTFMGLFKGLDVELPVATRALITITETVRNPVVFGPVLIGLLLGLYALSVHFRSPVGRRQWDWLKLEIPYLGPLAKRLAFSRIARTLGILLSSGVGMLASLQVAGLAAGNSVVRDAMERVAFEMKSGAKLSDRLEESDLFPTVFVQLVAAGEESGELPVQLKRLADFFEDEVLVSLAIFTSLMEPVMILLMGGIVMFVLVAVFQPVYQLMTLF